MRPDGPSVHPSAVDRAIFAEKRSSQAHSGNGVRSVSIRKTGGKNSKKATSHTLGKCSNTPQHQPGRSIDTSRYVDDEPAIFVSSTDDETNSEQDEVASKTRKVGTQNGNVAVKRKRGVNVKNAKSGGNVLVNCNHWSCKQMFQSWDAMWYHASYYHVRGKKRTFECHLCRRTSRDLYILQKHMNSVHIGERFFQCPFSNCSQKFFDKRTKKTHINGVHTKEIAFKCTKCSYKSYYKQNLRVHVARLHHHHGD